MTKKGPRNRRLLGRLALHFCCRNSRQNAARHPQNRRCSGALGFSALSGKTPAALESGHCWRQNGQNRKTAKADGPCWPASCPQMAAKTQILERKSKIATSRAPRPALVSGRWGPPRAPARPPEASYRRGARTSTALFTQACISICELGRFGGHVGPTCRDQNAVFQGRLALALFRSKTRLASSTCSQTAPCLAKFAIPF